MIVIRPAVVKMSDDGGSSVQGGINWVLAGYSSVSFTAAKEQRRPRLDPKAGRDFFSLMLCCPLIPLAYILSLPSLRQQANRGKEQELSSWHASLSKQIEESAVRVCVNC